MSKATKGKRKSRKSETRNDQQDSQATKKVQLPRLKQDYPGLGYVLEQAKKRRRQLSSYESQMEGRVLFLLREQKKTRQSIQKKQSELQKVLEIRRRQMQEKMHKDMVQKIKENQLNHLRRHSVTQRQAHQNNIEDTAVKIQYDRRKNYMLGKRDSMRADKHKEMVNQHQLLRKQSMKLLVDESIHMGRQRIEQFKADQNREFSRQYKKRISRQQIMSRDKLRKLESLEKEQSRLLNQIQKSQQSEDMINQKLGKAFDLDLQDLEREVIIRQKTRSSSSQSRRLLSSRSLCKASEKQLYSIESKRDIYSSKKNLNPENRSLSRKSSYRNSLAL